MCVYIYIYTHISIYIYIYIYIYGRDASPPAAKRTRERRVPDVAFTRLGKQNNTRIQHLKRLCPNILLANYWMYNVVLSCLVNATLAMLCDCLYAARCSLLDAHCTRPPF